MKTTLAGTLVAVLLAAAPALAQHPASPVPPPGVAVQGCDVHNPPAARPGGRYELRTVQKWVEGRYEQVWVAPVCKQKHRRHFTVQRCRDGYYRQEWREGYYAQVQEWVWVPVEHRRHEHGWRRADARVDVQVDPFAVSWGGGVQANATLTPGQFWVDVNAGF